MNVIQECWRQAREEFPDDRDRATERYRELLEEKDARACSPLNRKTHHSADRTRSDIGI